MSDIVNANGNIAVGSSNETSCSDSVVKNYKFSLEQSTAVILHPSFLCPALKKVGDDLNLFVLVDSKFHTTYMSAEGKLENKAGPSVSGAVNRFLKMVSWDSIDKTRHASSPIFSTNCAAVENIEVYYLWNVSELKNSVLNDKDGKPFAQIHPDVLSQYKQHSLNWGFQIVIKNLPNDSPGLYDISWVRYVKPENEGDDAYFFEMQDVYFDDYNTNYRSQYFPLHCDVSKDERPVFTETPSEIESYHPIYISNKPCLDIGHLSDVHISARQHLFTHSGARLIDGEGGHQSEPIGSMVNTSYATLKNLMNKMGDKIDLLVFTGDLIDYNRNYNPDNGLDDKEKLKKSSGIWQALNLDNLTDKQRYPVGIDNLVMYELFRWYYKTHNKPILLVSGNHEAYTLPYGISPRVKLWRSINSTYNFFTQPTIDKTIQKSIKQAVKDRNEVAESEKKGKGSDIYDNRANEGIPADHNLTITEAILMYGPDYARIVMSASYNWGNEKNFRAENLKWFFHVFTPLTSCYLTYGDQCFITLGWGDDERFVGHIPKAQGEWKAGGFLPRSVEGVTNQQFNIFKQALKAAKTQNILCSHFTYVNYNTNRPIGETGGVRAHDSYGRHDYGTFESNRDTVYPLIKKKIQYALSGHSHRSGLYQITKDLSYVVETDYGPEEVSEYEVKGQAAISGKFKPQGGSRFLVAASGGPIPVQNHENELYNWGLDVPSGNYIIFSGSDEQEVGVIKADIPQSKPRLAVALDYADIFLRDDGEKSAFELFESESKDGKFIISFKDVVKLNAKSIISKVRLVFYRKEGLAVVFDGDNAGGDSSSYQMEINTKWFDVDLDAFADNKNMGFVDISLNSEGVDADCYDTAKNWVFPISVIDKQKEELKKLDDRIAYAQSFDEDEYSQIYFDNERKRIINTIKGFRIQRHSLYGEIPDFRFYRDMKADEYG